MPSSRPLAWWSVPRDLHQPPPWDKARLRRCPLRRLPPHVFSVVLSLEPAVAALAGFVFLHEHLRARAWIAIGLVVAASAGAARRRRSAIPPDL